MATSLTRRNKNNGQAAQKRVCKIIGEVFPELKIGGPLADPHTVNAKPKCMGLPGEDIEMDIFARKCLKMSIEVKYTSGNKTMQKWYDQAARNALKLDTYFLGSNNSDVNILPGDLTLINTPVVCVNHAQSRKVLAILDLEDLLNFIRNPHDIKRFAERYLRGNNV